MDSSLSLRDATVQEIQLELIRRMAFNAYDGEHIYDKLLRHRNLWQAVLFDRPGVPDYTTCKLPTLGLIKLRDLPDNIWNADQLFILTATKDDARELGRIAKDEEWGGEVVVYEDQAMTDRALGVGRLEYGLLSIWWD